MSEIDVKNMLANMNKHQLGIMHEYARFKAAGKAIPADVTCKAAKTINCLVVTMLWDRPLRAEERTVVLEAMCKVLAGKKGEVI